MTPPDPIDALIQTRIPLAVHKRIAEKVDRDGTTAAAWLRSLILQNVRDISVDGSIVLADATATPRIPCPMFDDVVSGDLDDPDEIGFAPTSCTILVGPPAVGTTTAILQAIDEILETYPDRVALFIQGDVHLADLLTHAQRLGLRHVDRIRCVNILYDLHVLENVDKWLETYKPVVVAIDRIQAIVRKDVAAAEEILQLLKERSARFECPVIIGMTPHPRMVTRLKHAADTALFMEIVDKDSPPEWAEKKMRVIRCNEKHRFGPVPREAYFEMTETGLKFLGSLEQVHDHEDDE